MKEEIWKDIEGYEGEDNGFSKLKNADIAEIQEMLKNGKPQKVIAAKFGVSQAAISRVKLGKTWKSV